MKQYPDREKTTTPLPFLKSTRFFALLAGLVLLFVLCAVILVKWPIASKQTNQDGSAVAGSSPSAPRINGYSVVGKQILQNGTTPFIPYGVQLGGITMAVSDWATNDSEHLMLDEVLAARNIWHANTVSLQLASANLSTDADADSYLSAGTTYLTRVDQIVNWVLSNNMNILLVLQYEGLSDQTLPTQDSLDFWSVVAQRYANRTGVFFDVFNEPRLPNGGDDDASAWSLWKNGGVLDGMAYVGMQQLVNTIRKKAQNNLILVDGLAAGEDIHLLSGYTLAGGNLVYAIHPYLDAIQHGNSTQWDGWFGDTVTAGNFPVVADEWSEYQNPNDGECFADAPQVVPLFLTYLRQKGVGLIGYALFPGTLIRGWNFADPTRFDQAIYTCDLTQYASPNISLAAEGVGQLLMRYFQTYARRAILL